MLNAFRQQLLLMSKDNKDRYIATLKKKVGSQLAPEYYEEIKNFILVMPDMIRQINVWAEQEDVPSNVKVLHGMVLTYLYHPVDFLHDEGYGFLGYLDDAYLVGRVYQITMLQVQHENLRFLPNQEDYSLQLTTWIDVSRKTFSKEMIQIESMIREFLEGKRSTFDRLLNQPNRLKK